MTHDDPGVTAMTEEKKELLGAQSATPDATAGNVGEGQLSHAGDHA